MLTKLHTVSIFNCRHTMLIRDVRMEDFGNYSCSASNMLGKARAYITVQGEPMIENASYRQADSHIPCM